MLCLERGCSWQSVFVQVRLKNWKLHSPNIITNTLFEIFYIFLSFSEIKFAKRIQLISVIQTIQFGSF